MKLSAKDHKAIAWYSKNYNLRPQLSTPPVMYFRDAEGEMITKDLTGITLEYNQWNKADQRRRAYEKKVADNRSVSRK